jgi:C4-type Zn-finger protein
MNTSSSSKGPVVTCPGCRTEMRLVYQTPAVGGLNTATFQCEGCGMETKREFKAGS